MRYERLLAELVAGLLLGSPMYKYSHEPLFVCVLMGRKEEPPLGLTCVASRQQLVPGVAQVAHLEAAIHSESGCLYMGYPVLLSCWHQPSRKESRSSACEILCGGP